MLKEIGVESYYVLIHTRRGVVNPEWPSPLVFNHAILAIRIPQDAPSGLGAAVVHPQLGPLLFFDPTDPYIRLGDLPAELQANDGLLVANGGGELVRLPLAPAPLNSMERTARLQLKADGTLEGRAEEIRKGWPAADFRGAWLNASEAERRQGIQSFFGRLPAASEIDEMSVKELDHPADPVLAYRFRLPGFARSAAGLVVLRPKIFADWSEEVLENGERKQPVEFPGTRLRRESVEITLPEGFSVDELPPLVHADIGIASYSSKTEIDGKVLRYSRQLQINDVTVKTEQLPDLKKFYRQVAAGEKARFAETTVSPRQRWRERFMRCRTKVESS